MDVGFGEGQLCLHTVGLEQRRQSQFQFRQITSAPQQLTNYLREKVKDEGPDALKGIWFMIQGKKNYTHVW